MSVYRIFDKVSKVVFVGLSPYLLLFINVTQLEFKCESNSAISNAISNPILVFSSKISKLPEFKTSEFFSFYSGFHINGVQRFRGQRFLSGGVTPATHTTPQGEPLYISQDLPEQTDPATQLQDPDQDFGWAWAIPPISYMLILAILLLVWPRSLLRFSNFLEPYKIKLPGGAEISARFLLLWFSYHPKVLDAWVDAHIKTAYSKFVANDTVEEREIYVPVPLKLDDELINQLREEHYLNEEITIESNIISCFKKEYLRVILRREKFCLLISGEGGSGKTSFACQVMRWIFEDCNVKVKKKDRTLKHSVIPLLIEQDIDIDFQTDKNPLLEVIGGKLQDWLEISEPVSDEFLEALLRKCRIVVVLDHLSEMTLETRRKIQPNLRSFPVNGLIVTSRISEKLGGVSRLNVETLRIDGKQLSGFVFDYLKQRDKRHLFESQELHFACSQLEKLVGEHNTITVLLAKLYAEQMIISKTNLQQEQHLPDNIPDLILNYLRELNFRAEQNTESEYSTLEEDTKLIAWKCLENNLKPKPVKREILKNELLNILNREDPEVYLDYFERNLHLIRTIDPAKDKVRFVLDPIAEYLAGLHLTEKYNENEECWNDFIGETKKLHQASEIHGFLLALVDCCIARQTQCRVPKSVIDKISDLAGLNLQVIEAEKLKKRISILISELSSLDALDRTHAASVLEQIGADSTLAAPYLRLAIPHLVKSLSDVNPQVRQFSAFAIVGINPKLEDLKDLNTLVEVLTDALLHAKEVRTSRQSAEALGRIGIEEVERTMSNRIVSVLTEVLENINFDEAIRRACAESLGNYKQVAKYFLPALLEAIEEPYLFQWLASNESFTYDKPLDDSDGDIYREEMRNYERMRRTFDRENRKKQTISNVLKSRYRKINDEIAQIRETSAKSISEICLPNNIDLLSQALYEVHQKVRQDALAFFKKLSWPDKVLMILEQCLEEADRKDKERKDNIIIRRLYREAFRTIAKCCIEDFFPSEEVVESILKSLDKADKDDDLIYQNFSETEGDFRRNAYRRRRDFGELDIDDYEYIWDERSWFRNDRSDYRKTFSRSYLSLLNFGLHKNISNMIIYLIKEPSQRTIRNIIEELSKAEIFNEPILLLLASLEGLEDYWEEYYESINYHYVREEKLDELKNDIYFRHNETYTLIGSALLNLGFSQSSVEVLKDKLKNPKSFKIESLRRSTRTIRR